MTSSARQFQHSLFPAESAPRRLRRPRPPAPMLPPRRTPLWLALLLPELSLQIFLRGQPFLKPQAVIETSGNRAHVHACDACAQQAGVQTGMPLAAAWVLCPELEIHERDTEKEKELLHRLAGHAGRFTSRVAIDGSNALLLDVRASLKLFGGAKVLQDSVRSEFEQLGYSVRSALAPTPLAALWLARRFDSYCIEQTDTLAGELGCLPVSCLALDEDKLQRLHGMGLRRVRDLLRLPRDGFARRFGQGLLLQLDKALLKQPDLRDPVKPPPFFRSRIELLYEVENASVLLEPAKHLFKKFDAYLRTTQQGTSRWHLRLHCRDKQCVDLPVGHLEASRDAQRMQRLLEQKLENFELPAPVIALELEALQLQKLTGRDQALFEEQGRDEGVAELLELLRARLGHAAVSGVQVMEDHRPEHAVYAHLPEADAKVSVPGSMRPFWLLEQAEQLRVRNGRPYYEGELKLLDGPERIESGWWDGKDCARDYYRARTGKGMDIWIYRERRSGEWWLHGLFG